MEQKGRNPAVLGPIINRLREESTGQGVQRPGSGLTELSLRGPSDRTNCMTFPCLSFHIPASENGDGNTCLAPPRCSVSNAEGMTGHNQMRETLWLTQSRTHLISQSRGQPPSSSHQYNTGTKTGSLDKAIFNGTKPTLSGESLSL